MSFSAATPFEYRSGFKNPSGGRPFDSRAELSSETMPANVGADADVPPIDTGRPRRKTRKNSPCAATSGIAYPSGRVSLGWGECRSEIRTRPLGLKRPA